MKRLCRAEALFPEVIEKLQKEALRTCKTTDYGPLTTDT